jgi:hypothetical protein
MRSSAHAQISHQKAKKLYKNQDKTANNPWLHQVFGIYTWVKNRWTQKSKAWRCVFTAPRCGLACRSVKSTAVFRAGGRADARSGCWIRASRQRPLLLSTLAVVLPQGAPP